MNYIIQTAKLIREEIMSSHTENFSVWMRAADIQSSIAKCGAIFNSGIINSNNTASILFESLVTLLIINLSDLLQKASADGARVDFKDDVVSASDVTELIRLCRNAACHVSSGDHNIDSKKFTFCVAAGYGPKAFKVDGVEMGCDYADDIAIYYGELRVYIVRHLIRCFEEVSARYGQGQT